MSSDEKFAELKIAELERSVQCYQQRLRSEEERYARLESSYAKACSRISELQYELSLQVSERDRARAEWYAWMKLAVGNGVSLGTDHMPPFPGQEPENKG
jgi:hypothetical protein